MGHIGETGVDEYSVISMKFEGGAIAVLKSSISSGRAVSAKICGRSGYIVVDNFNGARDCRLYDNADNLIEEYHDEIENGFVHEVRHIAELFLSGEKESGLIPHEDTIFSAKIISDCLNEWKA